jgi:hypothetical protein
MHTKKILAAGAVLVIANNAGYQGRCEIKPEQCLHNAPDHAAPQKPIGALMREAGVSHGVGLLAALVQTMLTPRRGQ